MRFKEVFNSYILPLLIVVLMIINATINGVIKEQILSIIVSVFGLIIIETLRKYIFNLLIDSKQDIINRKLKLLSLIEKITDYEKYISLRKQIIRKNNKSYFNQLSRYFYNTYKHDISKFRDIEALVCNEKEIIDEIIINVNVNKDKTYQRLLKSFKIINKDMNHDSNFSRLYLDYKNHKLLNPNNQSGLTTFLSIISILGFAMTFTYAILDTEPFEFLKILGIYMVAMLFFESFMGIIYYNSAYFDRKNFLISNIELLSGLGETIDEIS